MPIPRLRIQTFVVSLVVAVASGSRAESEVLKWHQALMYNGVPAPLVDTPGYTTAKCLLPYPLCKVQWALVGTVAAAEQLVVGGDVQGARSALARGYTGDWIVRPGHVSGEPLWSAPFPVTFGAAILTGQGNRGARDLDPYRTPARETTTEGDVLPP